MSKIKKLFSIVSLLIIFFLFSRYIKEPATAPVIITSKIAASNRGKTIILWDLHGVVFTRKLSAFMSVIWNYNRKLEILQHLNTPLLKLMGNFLLQILHFTPQEVTSEEFIVTARKANNYALVELATQIGSAYYPIESSIKIIKELNKLGYQQNIGSNIGSTIYEIFKEKYPAIFKYFHHAHIVRHYPGKKIIKKPNKEYFITYITNYNIKAEQVIFIDDKLANVQAAQSIGMHTIHFKNPYQLRTALQNLGISLSRLETEKYAEQTNNSATLKQGDIN